ncbi:hypothetical protein BMF35_a0946 [Aurantiacibacter gangjinensis]|nr:hypothetical protein BMF35_a0946 [Aurantiacibacter gangjinensis]
MLRGKGRVAMESRNRGCSLWKKARTGPMLRCAALVAWDAQA